MSSSELSDSKIVTFKPVKNTIICKLSEKANNVVIVYSFEVWWIF